MGKVRECSTQFRASKPRQRRMGSGRKYRHSSTLPYLRSYVGGIPARKSERVMVFTGLELMLGYKFWVDLDISTVSKKAKHRV